MENEKNTASDVDNEGAQAWQNMNEKVDNREIIDLDTIQIGSMIKMKDREELVLSIGEPDNDTAVEYSGEGSQQVCTATEDVARKMQEQNDMYARGEDYFDENTELRDWKPEANIYQVGLDSHRVLDRSRGSFDADELNVLKKAGGASAFSKNKE